MNTNLVNSVQSMLDTHGVKDVKLFFSPQAFSERLSEVKSGVAYILDAFYKGEHTPLQQIGDSKK